MILIISIGVFIVFLWLIRFFAGAKSINRKPKSLQLILERDHRHDPEVDLVTFLNVAFDGPIYLPDEAQQAVAKVRITDVTDPDQPLPVRSLLEGASDDEGFFAYNVAFDIPNGQYLFHNFLVFSLLLDGLHAPYEGGRTFKVHVQFSTSEDGPIYSEATKTFHFIEDRTGYLEIQQLLDVAESLMQRLVELFSTSVGMENIGLVETCIDELLEFNVEGLTEAAYQRCLNIARSLTSLSPAHRDLLQHIAKELLLPPELVTELNDRHLRLSTMEGATDHESIGMPGGLTVEQQLDFLAAEYRKWRTRVTHIDPSIAAEATARLEAIARARSALTSDS